MFQEIKSRETLVEQLLYVPEMFGDNFTSIKEMMRVSRESDLFIVDYEFNPFRVIRIELINALYLQDHLKLVSPKIEEKKDNKPPEA